MGDNFMHTIIYIKKKINVLVKLLINSNNLKE